MENTIASQAGNLLAALAWGGAVGVYYLALGPLRMGGFWLTALADLLFWTVAAGATALFLIVQNGGEASGYMLCGIAAGALAVRMSIGSAAHSLAQKVAASARQRRRIRRAKKFSQKNR